MYCEGLNLFLASSRSKFEWCMPLLDDNRMVDATPRTPPMTLSFVALDAPPPPYPHDTSYSLTIHRPHPVRFNTDLPFSGYRSEPSRIVRSTVLPRTLRTDFNFRSIADSTDGDDDTLSLHNRDAAIFADQGSEENSSEDNFDAATVADSEHDGILRRGIGSRAAAAAADGHNLLHSMMDTHQRMEHNYGHDQQTRGTMAPMFPDISPCPTCHREDYNEVQQDHGFRLMPRKNRYQDQEEKGCDSTSLTSD